MAVFEFHVGRWIKIFFKFNWIQKVISKWRLFQNCFHEIFLFQHFDEIFDENWFARIFWKHLERHFVFTRGKFWQNIRETIILILKMHVLLAGKKIREMFQVTRWMQNRPNYKTWNREKFNFNKIFRESRLSNEHGQQFFVKLNKSYLFRLHCKSGILRVVFSWNHF